MCTYSLLLLLISFGFYFSLMVCISPVLEWGSHKKYLSEGVTLEFKGRTENRFHPALNTLFDRSPEAEGAHERICQKNNF